MKIGFLITARLKSSRLKLKLLLPLNGRTVIERVIQRAKLVVECDDIVLCTSTLNQDLPLIRTAQRNKIYYFNGHPDDVLQRLLDASLLFNFDFFIGITADNPLFSIHHANLAVEAVSKNPGLDFVFTTEMPIGINTYAIKVDALKTVCAIKQQVDTEIWGYLINRPEIFNVLEIKASKEYVRDNYRITLDEFADYRLFSYIFNRFPKDEVIDILDAYDILDSNPNISQVNRHVVQRDLDKNIKSAIDDFFEKNKDKILFLKNEIYAGRK